MKTFIALTLLTAAAILGSGFQAAALSQSGNGQNPKSEAALRCLVGLGQNGCARDFGMRWRYFNLCAGQYVHDREYNCPNGPLETVRYLGTDAYRADVYAVNYMNAATTYVVFPPAPDGKIPRFYNFDVPATQVIGKINVLLVRVTSPSNPVQILYTRPQQGD
jgi:hypothetical protein